ncbi:tRNA (adenosine(37)-N6)-threonylcarbamoyltransferase complex dimerization subunit type 1 TsaB [Subtercola sp. PAMC28395]|nr:tRNA (adenosine(37)-N6)-threonylcarbamoyltransferase complex dimerization subunit type 1 TsaB [Subtercola sp. PAMC28395]QWT25186.1 tRNA (adenosine(37)-N6)-threonylcarbamoyltransferase complex dimerization subunit type 1 TsaB [Subtercola sp. PAMC28395]
MVLAIDTSAATSVAVVSGERGILSEANGLDTMKHAEVIGRLIEQALTEAGVRPAELTAVVAGMGPGPFTGLRVGIAAAHAFAIGAGIDVLPVVSHDAVAFERRAAGEHGELLVVTDARRREVYWSLYDLGAAEAVADSASPGASGESGGARIAGAARRLDGPGLAKPDSLAYNAAARVDATQVSAGALGTVALGILESGDEFATGQALYLRSPDVTVSTSVKRVSQ